MGLEWVPLPEGSRNSVKRDTASPESFGKRSRPVPLDVVRLDDRYWSRADARPCGDDDCESEIDEHERLIEIRNRDKRHGMSEQTGPQRPHHKQMILRQFRELLECLPHQGEPREQDGDE